MDQTIHGTLPIENYETKMPVRAGIFAGFIGSLGIMVVVAVILVIGGTDIWTAARLIATVVYGPDAAEGAAPIIVGTLIHLITGSTLGAIFARLVPCLPRGFWIVVGLMYGLAAWGVSAFIILPIIAPPMIAADTNIYVLLIAHIVYGFVLGAAGATYDLWWHLPDGVQPTEKS